MLRVLMPRFYALFGVLTIGAVVMMLSARSRDETPQALGWLLGSALGVAVLVASLVMRTLMRRVRPPAKRGRHAER